VGLTCEKSLDRGIHHVWGPFDVWLFYRKMDYLSTSGFEATGGRAARLGPSDLSPGDRWALRGGGARPYRI